jgi:hypothetical protein
VPRITVALATPIEPRQQTPYGVVAELLQAGGVPMDSGVMVIPTACGVQPLEQDWQPEGATLLTPRGEALERGPELLPGGPACEVLAPLALLSPPPLEPQQLAARLAGLSVPTEREDPGLGA